jgi:hypothetical protein
MLAQGLTFNDTQQMHHIYLHAMPLPWQSKFEDVNKTIADMLFNGCHAYLFQKQAACEGSVQAGEQQELQDKW